MESTQTNGPLVAWLVLHTRRVLVPISLRNSDNRLEGLIGSVLSSGQTRLGVLPNMAFLSQEST